MVIWLQCTITIQQTSLLLVYFSQQCTIIKNYYYCIITIIVYYYYLVNIILYSDIIVYYSDITIFCTIVYYYYLVNIITISVLLQCIVTIIVYYYNYTLRIFSHLHLPLVVFVSEVSWNPKNLAQARAFSGQEIRFGHRSPAENMWIPAVGGSGEQHLT